MGTIVSNLPFVEYNKVADDEQEYIAQWREKITNITGIKFTRKRIYIIIYHLNYMSYWKRTENLGLLFRTPG